MIRELVIYPNKLLSMKAEPVKRFDPQLRALAKDMIETLNNTEGVGLAGPQIGVLQRLFVMKLKDKEGKPLGGHNLKGETRVLVNPQLLAVSHEVEEGIEGCLSIPDIAAFVMRPKQIVMQARNEWGKSKRYMVDGLLARVMLHEMDHLDGLLFFDRVEGDDKLVPMAVLEAELERQKQEKEEKEKEKKK
ncbi:MAG: peptide deformylase [Ardenticatenaceae bacterium]